jgi:outer membrane protein
VVKLVKVIVLMGSMLAASLVGAQAAAGQGKIAVFDMQTAILRTDLAQKRIKALEAQPDYDAGKKSFDKLKKEYEEMVRQLQKDLAVMSPEQKEAQGKKLEGKRSDMDHIFRKLQANQQEVVQKVMQELDPKFKKVMDDLIKSENISLLLDARSTLYVDSSFDITGKVTEQLNKVNN